MGRVMSGPMAAACEAYLNIAPMKKPMLLPHIDMKMRASTQLGDKYGI